MKGVVHLIRACSVCILGWPNLLQDLQRGGVMATHLCHMATFNCEQPIKTKKKRKGGRVETMRGRKERRSAEEESGSCQLHCIARKRACACCPRNAPSTNNARCSIHNPWLLQACSECILGNWRPTQRTRCERGGACYRVVLQHASGRAVPGMSQIVADSSFWNFLNFTARHCMHIEDGWDLPDLQALLMRECAPSARCATY
jgi:hypothetical protein